MCGRVVITAAAREGLKNFVLAAQHGSVPDAAPVRGFSLNLQSRLIATATAVTGMNNEIGEASKAIGKAWSSVVDGHAGAKEIKAALKELNQAEAAATAALAACDAAKKAGSLVTEPWSLTIPSDGPAFGEVAADVGAGQLADLLSASVAGLRDAQATVTAMVQQAMGGKRVSGSDLGDAMSTLNAAVVDVSKVHELLRRV